MSRHRRSPRRPSILRWAAYLLAFLILAAVVYAACLVAVDTFDPRPDATAQPASPAPADPTPSLVSCVPATTAYGDGRVWHYCARPFATPLATER